jgi:hypothetical protein
MNLRWLRPGDVLAAGGGALLLISLFLDWYSTPGGGGLTGWRAFAVTDVLLALLGVLGLGVGAAVVTRRTPVVPVALGVIGSVAGPVGVLLVLFRLLDPPGESLGIAVGALLGLAGALGVAAGAWWSLSDERNRGVPPVPSELRPAP